MNFFALLLEEKKLAATAATNKRRLLFLLSSSSLWFMIKIIMNKRGPHKKMRENLEIFKERKSQRFTVVYDKT
jgi:hypothetical protein